MDASTSSERQVSTISKNCEEQDDKIKIGFDSKKITCVIVKKPFSLLFWVLVTMIILFALGGTVFEGAPVGGVVGAVVA